MLPKLRAILYRDTEYKQPLANLVNFLRLPQQIGQKETNFNWLKDKLRVLAVGRRGKNWNSGMHEWLTCDQTLEAIYRTAGLRLHEGFASHLPESLWGYLNEDGEEKEYPCSEFNWLDLQLLLRTPNKYVIFRSRIDTIENGHCGAVNMYPVPTTAMTGKCTAETINAPSEDAFHQEINRILAQSRTISDFVNAIHQKYEVSIFHDGTPIRAGLQNERKFLIDGTTTDNQLGLENFKTKLFEPHRFFHHCKDDITTHQRG